MQSLYQYKDFFKLIIASVEHIVDEPISWDTVIIKMIQDIVLYGFNYEFVEDKVQLEFDEGNGFELISDYYEQVGSDGQITFQYGYYAPSSQAQVIEFSGTINLNTFKKTVRGCTCQIEKQAFESLIRTRLETKVDLNSIKTLDDKDMEPAPYLWLKLHSKTIKKQSTFATPTPISFPYVFIGLIQDAPTVMYLQPDTVSVTSDEVQTVSNMPPGFNDIEPIGASAFQLKAMEAGVTNISFTIDTTIHILAQSIDGGFAQPSQITIQPYLHLKRGGTVFSFFTNTFITTFTGNLFDRTFPYNSNECKFTLTLEVDDEIYIGATMQGISFAGDPLHFRNADVINYKNQISIVQDSVAPVTVCQAYRLKDAFEHVIHAITGVPNAIQSDILTTGCASKYAITNGYQIRNFESDKRPVQISLTQLIEGANPIWNLGMGYKDLLDGSEAVVIENMDYFYSGTGIMYTSKEQFNYREEHDPSKVFNKITVGFDKYSEDELNTIDDFSTYHEYMTPIKTYKAEKPIKSGFIASGYSIEIQRREQFKSNPSTSLAEDDDIFIINYVTESRIYNSISHAVLTVDGDTVLSFSRELMLLVGDKLIMHGANAGANDGVEYIVTGKLDGYFEYYTVTPALAAITSGTIQLELPIETPAFVTPPAFFAEAARDERFDTISGVLSPSTAYNLEISPQRMLLNWSSFLNIGLTRKASTEVLKNTFVKSNKDLSTKLPTGTECGFGSRIIREGSDVTISDLGYENRPYMPIKVYYDESMSYEDVKEIKKCLRGEGNGIKNFGFISFKDEKGIPWKGRVAEIKYDPNRELTSFTLYKVALL